MFEKRKEEEESPGCLNERRFDNILFSRKRKKDSEYLEYERILTHIQPSHIMRVPTFAIVYLTHVTYAL